MKAGPTQELALDGHVHLSPQAPIEPILRAAAANFARFSGAADKTGVLLLTESSGVDAFVALRAAAERGLMGLVPGLDPEVVETKVCDWTLRLVAGRQVVSAERLEVLAIGVQMNFTDGKPLAETLLDIRAARAVPVLPWGVGKWLGRRRSLIRRTLEQEAGAGDLLVGDIAGRPAFWREPLVDSGAGHGLRLLRGTDPLPGTSGAMRIGAFGSLLQVETTTWGWLDSLKAALRNPASEPSVYGSPVSTRVFLQEQIGIRLRRLAV